MSAARLHAIASAGSCLPFLDALEMTSAAELLTFMQNAVGDAFAVTGDPVLIEAGEDELHGGRDDDEARAAEITQALADDEVACVLSLRGGAWLARVLPRIDLSVLDRRTRPVALVGFSELTPLVNAVAAHENGIGIYDMGPGFFRYGLKREVELSAAAGEPIADDSEAYMKAHIHQAFAGFLADVVSMLRGEPSRRGIEARLVQGELDGQRSDVSLSGGNLVLSSTVVGTPYEKFIRPGGNWLVLEEINEKIERIDRFLSALTLAGWWDACAGLLLGDFHRGYDTVTDAVIELLPYHLPPAKVAMPVLVTGNVGHIHPMSPLPLHEPLTLEPAGAARYRLTCRNART